MQKKSTLFDFEKMLVDVPMVEPKAYTVNLLKQFARVYTVNSHLQPGLSTIIPN